MLGLRAYKYHYFLKVLGISLALSLEGGVFTHSPTFLPPYATTAKDVVQGAQAKLGNSKAQRCRGDHSQ